MANKLRELIVVLCLYGLPAALLADPQRTTATFSTNGAQATSAQQQPAQSTMTMDGQGYQQGSGTFYRQDAPPVAYPADQNYFFGGGFNKGFGFRVPDALSGAGYYNSNMHSPLGELWAVKADLIPAIFKTGLVVTVLIVIFKIVAFLVYAKKTALLGAGGALAGIGAPAAAPVAPVAPHVPVVSVLAERSRAGDESSGSNKIKREASPVVDAQTDFDAMLAQLETIRSHFEEMNHD